ncbi:unnamed protein product [Dovyalis caffra]|uniref:Uncharacterized protein n=1 Tax=Dovyalis caffra TaxID=77055 RepID=A0AAV1R8A1_9ROSI|nr:unnamed protein product [Dovyalis caffra]
MFSLGKNRGLVYLEGKYCGIGEVASAPSRQFFLHQIVNGLEPLVEASPLAKQVPPVTNVVLVFSGEAIHLR